MLTSIEDISISIEINSKLSVFFFFCNLNFIINQNTVHISFMSVPVNWLSPCGTEECADHSDLILLKTRLCHAALRGPSSGKPVEPQLRTILAKYLIVFIFCVRDSYIYYLKTASATHLKKCIFRSIFKSFESKTRFFFTNTYFYTFIFIILLLTTLTIAPKIGKAMSSRTIVFGKWEVHVCDRHYHFVP